MQERYIHVLARNFMALWCKSEDIRDPEVSLDEFYAMYGDHMTVEDSRVCSAIIESFYPCT